MISGNFFFIIITTASISINVPYIIMGNYIGTLAANCTKTKALLKNLFNLKSIKFLIIYVDTEHLSAKASRAPVN